MVLQAESGAGKTCLVQAGIVPRLTVEKHLAVVIRPQFENPTLAIRRCFLGNLELTPNLARAPLVDFLRRVKTIIGNSTTFYLILDQFEEFFVKETPEEDRQAFIRDLAQCLNDVTLDVRWVISITAEALFTIPLPSKELVDPTPTQIANQIVDDLIKAAEKLAQSNPDSTLAIALNPTALEGEDSGPPHTHTWATTNPHYHTHKSSRHNF